MSDYKFSCPHCDQHIACDETCFGQSVSCPSCQQTITVPTPTAQPPVAPPRRPGLHLSHQPPASSPEPAATAPAHARAEPPSQTDRPRSSLAIVAFILSLLGPLGAIPGIICGHLAMARLRRDAHLRGSGFARAGLIVSYVTLVLTLVLAGISLAGLGRQLQAQSRTPASPDVPPPHEAPAVPDAPAHDLGPVPMSVTVQTFRPMANGRKGGFTLGIENRSGKLAERLELQMEYRDADGVLEKTVPFDLHQRFPPNSTSREEDNGLFHLPTTRSVTVSVRKVSFADGSEWNPLKTGVAPASAPLSFAGNEAPATAEVLRFRPNTAKNGSVAIRFINHSNKAVQEFSLEVVCLDANSRKVDTLRGQWKFGSPSLMIAPRGVHEVTQSGGNMNAAATRAKIVVRSLTFASGETWKPAGK